MPKEPNMEKDRDVVASPESIGSSGVECQDTATVLPEDMELIVQADASANLIEEVVELHDKKIIEQAIDHLDVETSGSDSLFGSDSVNIVGDFDENAPESEPVLEMANDGIVLISSDSVEMECKAIPNHYLEQDEENQHDQIQTPMTNNFLLDEDVARIKASPIITDNVNQEEDLSEIGSQFDSTPVETAELNNSVTPEMSLNGTTDAHGGKKDSQSASPQAPKKSWVMANSLYNLLSTINSSISRCTLIKSNSVINTVESENDLETKEGVDAVCSDIDDKDVLISVDHHDSWSHMSLDLSETDERVVSLFNRVESPRWSDEEIRDDNQGQYFEHLEINRTSPSIDLQDILSSELIRDAEFSDFCPTLDTLKGLNEKSDELAISLDAFKSINSQRQMDRSPAINKHSSESFDWTVFQDDNRSDIETKSLFDKKSCKDYHESISDNEKEQSQTESNKIELEIPKANLLANNSALLPNALSPEQSLQGYSIPKGTNIEVVIPSKCSSIVVINEQILLSPNFERVSSSAGKTSDELMPDMNAMNVIHATPIKPDYQATTLNTFKKATPINIVNQERLGNITNYINPIKPIKSVSQPKLYDIVMSEKNTLNTAVLPTSIPLESQTRSNKRKKIILLSDGEEISSKVLFLFEVR